MHCNLTEWQATFLAALIFAGGVGVGLLIAKLEGWRARWTSFRRIAPPKQNTPCGRYGGGRYGR